MLKTESIPYIDSDSKIADFEKKRLAFWLDTVPSDVRRLEYELWKGYRSLHHLGVRQFDTREKIGGRHVLLKPFTEQDKKDSWQEFQESFLHGEDRRIRFQEILEQAKLDIPTILDRLPQEVRDKVRIIAITGSSAYGPRRAGERLSDIDINILIDTEDGLLNFEQRPSVEDKTPYHIVVTGYGDSARLDREMIHWLLYPHVPISNAYGTRELLDIINNLVVATIPRAEEIKKKISELDQQFRVRAQGGIEN